MTTKPAVLLVDDEPRILAGLRRQLRDRFEVHEAESGADALQLLAKYGPFPVLVTDMRMPKMDGATLCSLARARWPETIRIILSGQSDFEASLKAVNQGRIFRFLTKPISRDDLVETLDEAIELYRRDRSEKLILEETLNGSIHALGEIMALANPEIFGRAARVREMITQLCRHCQVGRSWEIEIASLFAHIGWVTIPPEVLRKIDASEDLTASERMMVSEVAEIPERILSRIPRLEEIREIIRFSRKNFDGSGAPDGPGGEHIPWGARALHVIRDVCQLEVQGHTLERAVQILKNRPGRYDPSLLASLTHYVGEIELEEVVREVAVEDLKVGCRIVEPVLSSTGLLLVSRGQTVTEGILSRLHNYLHGIGVRQPLIVAIPAAEAIDPTGTEGA